jgi:threonine/homoserine/homoserine lactone efflux protein
MEQFLAVAGAHFLALLIPGVDFFLIARLSLANGWRRASGACVGIATANGAFITAAFCGISLITNPILLDVIEGAGGGFLIFVGIAFLRSTGDLRIESGPPPDPISWSRGFVLGLMSGLLNPKNALFYASLAAAISASPPAVLAGYGVWMFSVVLLWDVLVAVLLGSTRALGGMQRALPWVTKIAGGFLLLFGAGMIARVLADVLR